MPFLPSPRPPPQVRLVDEEDTETDRRVMAVCYGPGNPATTFVMLDPSGNLVDFMHCPQFRWGPGLVSVVCVCVGVGWGWGGRGGKAGVAWVS